MKIIERLKKRLVGIGFFIETIVTKVFAAEYEEISSVYGVPVPEAEKENFIDRLWNNRRAFIIPIILLIGIIIYLKKSKSSKKRKIITVLITIGIVISLYFVMYIISLNI